jgi:hypothetical protein
MRAAAGLDKIRTRSAGGLVSLIPLAQASRIRTLRVRAAVSQSVLCFFPWFSEWSPPALMRAARRLHCPAEVDAVPTSEHAASVDGARTHERGCGRLPARRSRGGRPSRSSCSAGGLLALSGLLPVGPQADEDEETRRTVETNACNMGWGIWLTCFQTNRR